MTRHIAVRVLEGGGMGIREDGQTWARLPVAMCCESHEEADVSRAQGRRVRTDRSGKKSGRQLTGRRIIQRISSQWTALKIYNGCALGPELGQKEMGTNGTRNTRVDSGGRIEKRTISATCGLYGQSHSGGNHSQRRHVPGQRKREHSTQVRDRLRGTVTEASACLYSTAGEVQL